MDDNTSIQFRLRLAQINGIKMNEATTRSVKATPEAKAKAKAAMERMHGPGKITFSVSSNAGRDGHGHTVSHENDYGDENHHTYHPTTGKVERNPYMRTGNSDAF